MRKIQLDSKDGIAAGWAGAGFAGAADAHNLPDRVREKSSLRKGDSDSQQTPRAGLFKSTMRFARNAAVGLMVLSAVPFAVVWWSSNHITTRGWEDAAVKIEQAEAWRSLRAPIDASITPMEAGVAFARVQAPQLGAKANSFAASEAAAEFTLRETAPQGMWPWRLHKPGKDLFPVRTGGFEGPSDQDVIYNAGRGFSEAELAWLKQLAEAPVWKEFDKVASAQSVDMIGGQFRMPFSRDAFAPVLPFMKYASLKELAYAGVSRAAYYVAIGQPAQAEAALRSIVSFGFALTDNGVSGMDGIFGRIIVGIGRSALIQYAAVEHSPMNIGADPEPRAVRNTNFGDPRGARIDAKEFRKRVLNDVNDPSLPRTIRLERLSELSLNSCQSIPGMVFGPNQETRDVFAKVAPSLVRFPSEQAYLDLMLEQTNRVPEFELHSFADKFVVGAATVASTVTGNQRLAACTRMAMIGR